MLEITAFRYGFAQVLQDFLKYIAQRWRKCNPVVDRKTQSMRLAGTVIWILTDQDDFDFIKWAMVECRVDSDS